MQGSRSDSSSEMIFRGIRFVLFGFDSTSKAQYRSELVRRGGIDVGRYDSNCTHVIVSGLVYDDPVCVAAREDGKVLVTELWIDDSVDSGALVDASRVLYSPVKDLNGIPGSESLFICLTGYQKQDRDDIMKMVSLMGARFSKPLIANKVTHLICYKFEGEKYELAKKVKIKLVNHRWLEDCLKAWEILPIDNYKKSGWELEILEAEAMDTEEETEDPGTELLAQRNNKGTPSVQGNTFTASSSYLHTPNKEISMIHNGVSNANMQSSKEKSLTNINSDPPPCNDAPSDIYPKESLDISPKITTCDLDTTKVRESSNQTVIDLKGKGNILSSDTGSISGNQDKRYSTLSYSRKYLKGVTKELQSSSMVDSKETTTNGHQDIPVAEFETNNSPNRTKRNISDSTVGSKSPKLFSKQSPSTNISQLEPTSLMPNSHVETNNQFEGTVETNSRDKQYAALSKFSLGHRKFLKRGQIASETKNSRSLNPSSIQNEHMAQTMEPMQLDDELPTSETRSTPDIAEKALHDHEDLEKAGGSQNKDIDHSEEKAKETFNAVGEPDLIDKPENNVDLIMNDISKSVSDGLAEQENVSKLTSPHCKDLEIRKLSSDLNNEPRTTHADMLVSGGNIEPQYRIESASTDDKSTEVINVSKIRLGVRSKKVESKRNLNSSKSKTSKNTSSTDNAKMSNEADTSIQTVEVVPDKTTGPQSIKPLDVCTEKVTTKRNLSKSKLSTNTSLVENANISNEATTTNVHTEKVVSDIITEPQSISTDTGTRSSTKQPDICTKKTISKRKLSSKSKLSTNTSSTDNANISEEATTTNVDTKKVVSDIITEPQSISTDTGTRSSTKQPDICTKKTISKRKLSSKSKLSTNTSSTDNANISEEATTTNVGTKKVVSDIITEPQSISTDTGTRSSTKQPDICTKKTISKRKLSNKSKLSTNTSSTDNANISVEATATNVHTKKVVSDMSPEPQSVSTSTSLNSKGTGTRGSTKPFDVSTKAISKRNLSSKSKLSTNPSITDNANISDEATTSTSVKVNAGKPEKRKAGAMSKKPAGKGNKQVAEDAIVEDKLEPRENKAKKKLVKQTDASVDPEKENKPKENGNMSSHVDSHPNSKTPKQKGKGSILSKNNGQKAISRARVLEPDPVWFLLSGHRFQRKEFQRIIKGLKGRLCRDSHNWNYQATHFIVPDKVRRTEKFFAAAAAGRWILKADYLTASNEAGKFLPEEPYEWYDKGLAEDCAISLEAPRKWRQLRERTGHGAFYKMQIVIYGECITPSLETLKRAVKAGDGTILATSPPYTRFLNDRIDYAIISPGMLRVDKWVQEFMKHEIPCVAADYIVEYVCKPGHSLDRHVLFNTQSWAEKSFAYLQSVQEEAVIEDDSDDVSCSACGSRDRGEVMLLCNDCGAGTHIDCCDPPLKAIPEGDWFCPKCRKEETPKSESKSRKKKASSRRK